MTEPTAPQIVTLEPQPAALLREVVAMSDLPGFFGRAFGAAAQAAGVQGVRLAGPPLGVYFGMPGATVDVGAGFPTDRPVAADGGVASVTLPGGRAAQLLHHGPYDGLPASYDRLIAFLGEQRLTPGPVMWEAYLNEPDQAHPEATETLIVWPLADA